MYIRTVNVVIQIYLCLFASLQQVAFFQLQFLLPSVTKLGAYVSMHGVCNLLWKLFIQMHKITVLFRSHILQKCHSAHEVNKYGH